MDGYPVGSHFSIQALLTCLCGELSVSMMSGKGAFLIVRSAELITLGGISSDVVLTTISEADNDLEICAVRDLGSRLDFFGVWVVVVVVDVTVSVVSTDVSSCFITSLSHTSLASIRVGEPPVPELPEHPVELKGS